MVLPAPPVVGSRLWLANRAAGLSIRCQEPQRAAEVCRQQSLCEARGWRILSQTPGAPPRALPLSAGGPRSSSARPSGAGLREDPLSHRTLELALLLSLLPAIAGGQPVIQSRGVDPGVDYESLKRLGPWDDRNYGLTKEDLSLLADNEEELAGPLPAFFRVLLRRQYPSMPRTGELQYPRSALNAFELIYRGYLVDGVYHREVSRGRDGRWVVDPPVEEAQGIDRSLSGEVRVTSPAGAAESIVEVHPTDPDRVIAGSNGPGGGQRMHYSTDGGSSWTPVDLPLGGTCCDPTVDWSSDGTYAYAATLGGCGALCNVWVYRSDDGGVSWTGLANVTPGDPRRELTSANQSDKELIHCDKHLGSPFVDRCYLTWHDLNVMQIAVSTDFANSWTITGFGSEPQGIGSDVVTDKSGNLYYFWGAAGSREIRVIRSLNGGASFTPSVEVAGTNGSFDWPIPAMETRRAWIYAVADADLSDGPYAGSVYVAWTDTTAMDDNNDANLNHTQIHVAYSRDGGATWADVIPHETADALSVDRFNQWLTVGPTGTVHVIFYDTRESLPARDAVDLFHSYSTDGGQSYSLPDRLTSVTSPNLSTSFEWGDYNGLDAVLDQVIAVFTDNRNETGIGSNSPDIYAIGKAATGIFSDGFESGGPAGWNRTKPQP